jgi:hypothetical protein
MPHGLESASIRSSSVAGGPMTVDGGMGHRFFGYCIAIGLTFAGTTALAARLGPFPLVGEGGVVESLQLLSLILIGLSYGAFALTRPNDRTVYGLLAIAAFFTIERELHYHPFLRETWVLVVKYSAEIVLIGGTVLAARRTIEPQFWRLARRPAFSLLLIGFAVVTLWAQVLGQGKVWRTIEPDREFGRRYVEEYLELAGYLLILASVVEEGLYIVVARRSSTIRIPSPSGRG